MMNVKFLKINFSKNKNSQFIGNQFGTIFNNYNIPNIPYKDINLSLRESGKFDELFESQCKKSSPLYLEFYNSKIEQLIKLSQLYKYSPVLRVYGCFTSLSTIRQTSETSDLAQLELLEHRNLLKFIECNYETKIIISLDTNMIFSNNRYNVEQYNVRCENLINTIKKYKDYKNLKIVFDSGNTLETMYILDTLLICYMPSILFDNEKITYSEVVFDSEINYIINKIKLYDERFIQLEKTNNDLCKFMNFNNKEILFQHIKNSRENAFFNN